jgi:hypothetical protein
METGREIYFSQGLDNQLLSCPETEDVLAEFFNGECYPV